MGNIPFIYTVNDDLFIKNILSGAYLGKPDAHVVYMEYPLSFLIQGLYKWNAGIPWYGICLLFFHFIAWGSMFYRLLKVEKDNKSRILKALLLGGVFTSVGFYHMASMQYTVTAAVLGMAALVWFYTCDFEAPMKKVWKDNVITAILVMLSFSVRKNVLLMLLPFAGVIWLRKWLEYRTAQKTEENVRRLGTKIWTEQMERFGGIILMVGMSVLLISSVSYYGYRSEGWNYYKNYNDNATILYDYYGWPEYEENQELYEELGISYASYFGAKNNYLLSLDSSIDAEAMVKLAKRSSELHQSNYAVGTKIVSALENTALRMVQDTDRPLSFIVISLYGIIIALALWQKKKEVFISLAFLMVGRMVSWVYIVYEGRYPTRITQSLFLAECGVLVAILFTELWNREWVVKKRGWKKAILITAGVGYLFMLGGFSVARIRHVKAENNVRMEESQDLQDLQKYCGERLENFYMVDSKSITKDTESIFDKTGSHFENYIVFGGWLSGSPVFNDKIKNAGITNVEDALLNKENIYAIFENSEECKTEYLFQYFESKYSAFSYQVVDTFGRNKNQFSVYKMSN